MFKNLFSRKRMQDIGILTVVVVLIQMALSKVVYPLLGKTTQTLFAMTP